MTKLVFMWLDLKLLEIFDHINFFTWPKQKQQKSYEVFKCFTYILH
jgi:hypothetical protein